MFPRAGPRLLSPTRSAQGIGREGGRAGGRRGRGGREEREGGEGGKKGREGEKQGELCRWGGPRQLSERVAYTWSPGQVPGSLPGSCDAHAERKDPASSVL